ncbi:hypothetical protein ACFC0C_16425 [Streptomyces sp. NPDC056178]|uniref:hypothetical protein n=1 Tax=unclassified Streptomyces TaxID=2593676 RepID=UPI0035E0BB5C
MNDRAAIEAEQLYALAQKFDDLRGEITVPRTPNDLPHLVKASQQLATLSGLVKYLSGEVLVCAANDDPGLDLGPVIHAYTTAAEPAGRAVEDYTRAYAQLGFLRRFAEAPDSGNLRDGRDAAFRVAREHMIYVCDGLLEVSSTLRGCADRLDHTPPYVLVALSRSVRPTNSLYRLPSKPDTPALSPVRLAYTPAPRRPR